MARGGKREGAGRPKGQRSAATAAEIASISEMAKMHSQTALDALVRIATYGESESAIVAASNAILDRAFGKPQQAIDHSSSDGSMTPISGFDIQVVHAPSGDADKTAG